MWKLRVNATIRHARSPFDGMRLALLSWTPDNNRCGAALTK